MAGTVVVGLGGNALVEAGERAPTASSARTPG